MSVFGAYYIGYFLGNTGFFGYTYFHYRNKLSVLTVAKLHFIFILLAFLRRSCKGIGRKQVVVPCDIF